MHLRNSMDPKQENTKRAAPRHTVVNLLKEKEESFASRKRKATHIQGNININVRLPIKNNGRQC